MMWSEKYRPKSIPEMVGNEEARAALVEWFAKWKKGTKPLLLVGPPGTGKTTIANLSARQFGYDMIGLNASDVRSKSRINEILSPVLGNVSVMGRPMIFVDEVDGIHGRADFGGAEALIRILKEPTVPIILAANYDTSDKMKNIKKAVTTVSFRPLPPRLLRTYLEGILAKEGASLSPGLLIRTIHESRGDIRSMINLAQTLVTGFEPATEKSFEKMNMEEGINAFFKANTLQEARGVLYSIQTDPREKIGALYSSIITSNLPPEQMRHMLSVMSRADMLYGRIMRTQQWRLLRYLNDILLGLYIKDAGVRYSRFNLPWPLLNRIRWDGKNLRAFYDKVAPRLHVSRSVFASVCLGCLLFCIKNKKIELDDAGDFDDLLQKEMALIP